MMVEVKNCLFFHCDQEQFDPMDKDTNRLGTLVQNKKNAYESQSITEKNLYLLEQGYQLQYQICLQTAFILGVHVLKSSKFTNKKN